MHNWTIIFVIDLLDHLKGFLKIYPFFYFWFWSDTYGGSLLEQNRTKQTRKMM